MSDPAAPLHSEIDARWGVPGDERARLARLAAAEGADTAEPSFSSDIWALVRELDERDGFTTRFAARGVLRRPSDGRFFIFRYPFRDGSWRFVLPGGGAEADETPAQALHREVREETGTDARELRHSGLVLYHLLATTIYGDEPEPTIQYSPVFLGTIADELPDTDGREVHWFTIDEFEAQPRRPISDPLLAIMRAAELGEPVEPRAVWLPA